MTGTALWVWWSRKEDPSDADLAGGHVVAWDSQTPTDDQNTPTGPPIVTLAGLADPLVAATILETARADGGLVWIAPDFTAEPTLDNLLAIWGDDVVYTAVTHNGTNPTLAPETEADIGTADAPSGVGSDATDKA